MSNRTRGNNRMRETIFKVIDSRESGTVLTARQMCGILEDIDRRFWPTALRVTNLMRMSDHVQYDRKQRGYVVLGAEA